MFFSVDPGADATIGGMVATGASGTTSVRYGTMRENVLSLTVVTADGRDRQDPQRARKSSAGYDLTRLMIGSEARSALITEVTLRVQPTPEAMTAAACAFRVARRRGRHRDRGARARASRSPGSSCSTTSRSTPSTATSSSDLAVAPTLLLEFHGTPAETEAQATDVEAIARDAQRPRLRLGRGRGRAARAVARAPRRATTPAGRCVPARRAFTTDACVPISNLAACIAETKARPRRVRPDRADRRPRRRRQLPPRDPRRPRRRGRAGRARRRSTTGSSRRAIGYDGTCTGEHGVGYGKSAFLELEHGPQALAMMRAIKTALDPDGLFNPGKVPRSWTTAG